VLERPYRVLLVVTHPVQYAAPLFRRMAQDSRLDIQVGYCTLQGATPTLDAEFGVEVAWDIPLLEGYPWFEIPNRSRHPGLGRFFGLFNPGVWKIVRRESFDAVVLLTGYRYASFWVALAAAKRRGVPVLFGTDATNLRPRQGGGWKATVKLWLWPTLFRLADVVIVPSSGGVALMRSLGLPEDRVVLTPYVVDNDRWTAQAASVDRSAVRRQWGVEENAAVVLFCAKLQPWKRPRDLLRAFADAAVPGAYLIYAGEGPLRKRLQFEAESLGLAGRARFLGFINQSRLPAVYRAADLMVLPSDYEAFGVVVNEAMLCGCPVAVSDRVGAGADLVRNGENGYVFPGGDVKALAEILRVHFNDPARRVRMAVAARTRMATWSPRENIEGLVQAIERAAQGRTARRWSETEK